MDEQQSQPLNKRAFITYILIALGFTWLCWIPSLLIAQQADYTLPTISTLAAPEAPFSFAGGQHVFVSLLFSFAVYGPLLAGFVATYMAQGKEGAQSLLGRMLRWRIAGKWYLTAILLTLIITLLPLAVGLLIGLTSVKPGGHSFALTTFLFLLIFQMLTSGLGEEPGKKKFPGAPQPIANQQTI